MSADLGFSPPYFLKNMEENTMKQINLNKTDLKVSAIALGTDSFGSRLDEKFSFEMLDSFIANGGNLIDTAECYAQWLPNGKHASENTIGKWMKSRSNRHDIIISTKGGHFKYGTPSRLNRECITEDIEGSLDRLGTDYIDIYWLHRDDTSVEVGEIVELLNEFIKSGKARYIGASNWTYDRIEESNIYAKKHNLCGFISSQIQYSPAVSNVELNEPDLVIMNDNEYEYFKNHDMSVFAFASQAKGFFSKYLAGGEDNLSIIAKERYLNDETINRFYNLKQISEEKNCTMGMAVIAAIANNPDFQTIPIVGCKNIAHLEDSLSGADITFTKQEVDFIFNRK